MEELRNQVNQTISCHFVDISQFLKEKIFTQTPQFNYCRYSPAAQMLSRLPPLSLSIPVTIRK